MRLLGRILACALLLGASTLSHATVISGRFGGTVVDADWTGINDGDAIWGRFRFDTKELSPDPAGTPGRYVIMGETGFTHSFYIGGSGGETTGGMTLELSEDSTSQTMLITESHLWSKAVFRLVGPSGAFFSQIDDLSTLHGGPLDLDDSAITYFNRRISFGVDLDRFFFDGVRTVPEPSSLALLALALSAAAMRMTRRN